MIGQWNAKRFILRLAINIIAILAAVTVVPGLRLEGEWWGLALVALVFGILNTSVRPLLLLLAFPFVIITFGIAMLFINAAMLYLTSFLVSGFGVDFQIDGLLAAVLGSVVISVVSAVLGLLSGDNQVRIEVLRPPRDKNGQR